MIVATNVVLSWATFIVVTLVILEAFTRWIVKLKLMVANMRNETVNVEADVQAVMVDARNLNADPNAPTERIAAVNEYIQHRKVK